MRTHTEHYHAKAGSVRNAWRVYHTESGLLATPIGPLASVRKAQALRWLRVCERWAPTPDAQEASRLLIQRKFPTRYRNWLLTLHNAQSQPIGRNVRYAP